LTGADAEDLPRIFALADDPAAEVRDRLTHVIVQLTKHDLREKAASDAILKLMAKLPRDPRDVAHALWGAKFSPEIEARVLEFCREMRGTSGAGYDFFYGALSTQANKSEASCKRLIELLADQDTTNIAGRSAWGLQQGVDRAQFALVADAMVKVIEARSDGYLRKNALSCLRAYGNASQAPALQAVLAKPGVTGDLRKTLEETLAALEERPAEKIPNQANQTELNVTADGSVLLNGKVISLEELAGKLTGLTRVSADHSVLIRGDPAADYKLINGVLTVCREASVQRIAFGQRLAAAEAQPPKSNEEKKKEEDARRVEKNRQAARLRAAEDKQRYTFEQLGEIETLYQVANTKGKRDAEAKEKLKLLLEKYDKANRTGCATLYLGQASEGAERLEYLTRAVEKFSDCYYFDGCQVGGYGRYVLALTLWEKGEKDKARALFAELKTIYKDATDHRGRPMSEVAEAAEKELAAKQ
jgi:biopolymer transport protein ExbD